MKKQIPYLMKIEDASELIGISRYKIRQGCRTGDIPHVKSGVKYMVKIKEYLKQLGIDES